MEEVYWNDSEYESEGRSNGGSEFRVQRYAECTECAGIGIELIGRVVK